MAVKTMMGLQDDFNDLARDTTKWTQFTTGTATISQTGGQVVCTPPSSNVTSSYGGYDSANTYDLSSNYAVVLINTAVNAAVGAQQYMKLSADGSNNMQFILENGTLNFQKTVATVTTNLNAGVSFNATTHAWWRLRESLGTTYFDTSADGMGWTNQASTANVITLTALTVELAAGTYQSVASPGVGKFESFNFLPAHIKFNNSGLRPHPFSPGLAR